ncbi:MAG: DUF2877 domain-containing protein [Chloroflexota bacterium]|nr:DUF2877 domain-containing protein [Chloroflexota bacterium]
MFVSAQISTPGAVEALEQLRDPGRVLSRFQAVINVETAQGRLLAVQVPGSALGPFGLVLAQARVPEWPTPGTPASVQGRRLRIGPLAIDLGLARPAPAIEVIPPGKAWEPSRMATLLAPFTEQSAFGRIWAGSDDPNVGDPVEQAVRCLAAAVTMSPENLAAAEQAAVRIVGRGPGATPSGDDLLVGFLAAWMACRPGHPASRRMVQALAEQAPTRTTRLAGEFYYHLARGRLSEPLAILLRAVTAGADGQVLAAARSLAGYGATSGLDTIAGVECYLQACVRAWSRPTVDHTPGRE